MRHDDKESQRCFDDLSPWDIPMHSFRLSLALLLACWTADAACGQSFGRWNLPSTTAQVFGYGNGAGHHAPMVRTLGCKPERVPRVALVPCKSRVGCSACKQPNFVPMPTMPTSCRGGHCGVHAAPQQYSRHQHVGQTFPTTVIPQQVFSAPPTLSTPKAPMPKAEPTSETR